MYKIIFTEPADEDVAFLKKKRTEGRNDKNQSITRRIAATPTYWDRQTRSTPFRTIWKIFTPH